MENFASRFFAVAIGIAAALGAASACSAKSSGGATPGGGTDGGVEGGTQDGAVEPTDPPGMFHALEADLVSTCGGAGGQCHVNGTFLSAPKWLAGPDAYVSCRDYPGNIPASNDPLDSKLLTQVVHEGPALVTTPDLFDRVKAWVVAEVALRGTKLPATDPITVVNGPNTYDLSALAGGLAGTKLTFNASGSGKILTITSMMITAPFAKGLHIEAPFYVILPASGPTITDTTDGFGGTLDVESGQTTDFFGGSSVLTKWDPAGKLKIVFNKFDAVFPGDAGAPVNCANVGSFTANAIPAFKLDLGSGNTCQSCHAGGNAIAKSAMDLSLLDTDPAAACQQVFHRVVPKNPAGSPLLQTPTGQTGGDPSHPVKDVCPAQTTTDAGIQLCTPQGFIDGVTTWINAE
jgi:hypothetical protein